MERLHTDHSHLPLTITPFTPPINHYTMHTDHSHLPLTITPFTPPINHYTIHASHTIPHAPFTLHHLHDNTSHCAPRGCRGRDLMVVGF
jgi:hypothetical protein